MGEILAWLSAYSLPVVLLIGLGAVLLYVAKLITDKSIARQFDKYATTLNLQLQRRSRFEELILVKRHEFLSATRTKLDKVITNINRMHQGTQVEGFTVNGDYALRERGDRSAPPRRFSCSWIPDQVRDDDFSDPGFPSD